MHKANKNLVGIIILLLSFFVNTAVAQSAYDLLKNVTQPAENEEQYSMVAKVCYYKGDNDVQADMTDTIQMARNANSFYYENAEIIEIVNPSEIILIDKENKIIRISKTDGKNNARKAIASIISDDSSAYSVVSRTATEIRIRYQSETNLLGIVKADFFINLEDGIINQADYYYSGSEDGLMYSRISIIITQYDRTVPANSLFAGTSYYLLIKKNYIPTVSYAGYKIFFNH